MVEKKKSVKKSGKLKNKATSLVKISKDTAITAKKEIASKSSAFSKKYIDGTALDTCIDKVDAAVGFMIPRKKYEFDNEALEASYGPIIIGLWMFFILFIVFGLWAAFAPLNSAAIAQGLVALNSSKKTIQHLEGGIIADIMVSDGDKVTVGQPLIRLRDTRVKANVDILEGQIITSKATEARLISERDGKNTITFDAYTLRKKDDPSVAKIINAQKYLFETRKKTIEGQVAILGQRIKQFGDEIDGLSAQENAANTQLELINEEIAVVEELVKDGRATKPRLLALKRKAAELLGNRGEFLSRIARANQSITENKFGIINLRNERLSEVVTQIRDVQDSIADIEERLRAADDVLDRSVITAPREGIVTNLKYHTIGGVIAPGVEIMDIVPQHDELIIEAKVSPRDIDIVHNGLDARVRLSAFSGRTVPLLKGKVLTVSADRIIDKYTGVPYYKARVRIDKEMLDNLVADVELYPGMPADVLIITGERTMLSYLFTPLTANFTRAFRQN